MYPKKDWRQLRMHQSLLFSPGTDSDTHCTVLTDTTDTSAGFTFALKIYVELIRIDILRVT